MGQDLGRSNGAAPETSVTAVGRVVRRPSRQRRSSAVDLRAGGRRHQTAPTVFWPPCRLPCDDGDPGVAGRRSRNIDAAVSTVEDVTEGWWRLVSAADDAEHGRPPAASTTCEGRHTCRQDDLDDDLLDEQEDLPEDLDEEDLEDLEDEDDEDVDDDDASTTTTSSRIDEELDRVRTSSRSEPRPPARTTTRKRTRTRTTTPTTSRPAST